MGKSDFVNYLLLDIFRNIDGISSKGMFGGYGLYKDGVMFGLVTEDDVYFKVDENNKYLYESLDSKPFTYSKGNNTSITVSYWLVPPDILEDTTYMEKLITSSVETAMRVKKNKKNK
jgi:DNA transformation protein and related proteins